MPDFEGTQTARLSRALERVVAQADEYGDIAGVNGLAEIARRALAGKDVTALDTDQPDPGPSGIGHGTAYVLLSFLVTEDGERQHPMNTSVVKLNLDAGGRPDDASMTDLAHRVTQAALQKVNARRACL